MELKCVLCERRGGQEQELGLADFMTDPRSGALVCTRCYSSPEDNRSGQHRQVRQHGEQKAEVQSIAVKAALERKAQQEARNRGR